MKTAYSYQRFSNPKQVHEKKLTFQLAQAKKYADENGLFLNEDLSFQDLGVSAYRGLNRRNGELADFLLAVKYGLVEKGSYLLVESLDRISRDKARKALRTLEDICDEGITVVTLLDNRQYDSKKLDEDPTALLFSVIIFLVANEESKKRSQRVRAAWDRRRELIKNGENILLCNVFPTWIKRVDNEFVVVEEKAQIIRRVFELGAKGFGTSTITTILNREKVPALRSKNGWTTMMVRLLLINPAVIGSHQSYYYDVVDGERTKRPAEVLKNYFPRIVSQNAWNLTQKYVKERQHKWVPILNITRPYIMKNIFARLAKCPKCGRAMVRRYKRTLITKPGDALRFFLCFNSENERGCEYRLVPYQPLEEVFIKDGPQSLWLHFFELKQKPKDSELRLEVMEARLKDIEAITTEKPLDVLRLNSQLKNLFSRVVINYETGNLEFDWQYGGHSILPFADHCREYVLAKVKSKDSIF